MGEQREGTREFFVLLLQLCFLSEILFKIRSVGVPWWGRG